ncbi:diguanylate cyclase [Ideonella sp. 4Y16]|uniref:diguanylate cyclase domain-containing protein n=1 Tax=Ideonella alba TaxID=2824118 RepID=UPI001B36534C|nr:diguanylate cyclase [Ideonella alba]MBQ0944143.1 diguanylate cyclase [Ideonella alba]
MSVRPRSLSSAWWPLALAVGVVAAMVVLLAALALRQEHERRLAYAQGVTRNLALLIEAQLAGVLARADLRLTQMGAQAAGEPGGWQAAHPTPAPGLTVSGPERDARGTWVMVLSRPSAQPGKPPVSLSIPVDQFGAVLDRVSLGTLGAATIRTTDLALVYRHPLPPGGLTQIGSREVSAGLRSAVALAPEAGDFNAPTALDGIARLNAYQRVDGYPFYVIVGLPEQDFPRGWSRMDLAMIAVAAVSLLATLLGGWLLHLGARRQIDQMQRRHAAIVESSTDAILSKTLDGVVTSWNRGAERIFGWTAQEMVGQPLRRVVPDDLLDQEQDIVQRLQQGEEITALETERLCRDGRRLPMSLTISPVRDAQGRITGASTIARDISRQKALEAEIRALAFLDPLTQLPNRRLLRDRLLQAQQVSRRSGHWAAVIYLDLDGFKGLNDTHGHDVGDLFLVEVARRLKAAVRETDTVARLGGDEFVVLCAELGASQGTATEAVLAIEAKITHAVEAPWQLRDLHLGPRVSLGHRLFLGVEDEVDLILRDADSRMYADKQRRRQGR